ncbi:beta-1,4-galactosyltransferase 1-like [Takifugu rubripes]|uniref:Beta-1,4-galactosyltransferase n=1 Tax=Takifugu rubripes TaxID=31033 RepID=A0A674MGT7_TAKRU|nr:beta-1,4-galactosyltransferase 1-like [Takifugu rubripes]
MQKYFSVLVVLCALVTVMAGIVFVLYSQSTVLNYSSPKDFMGNATVSISQALKKHLDELLEGEALIFKEEGNNNSLKPCSDDSPNLIGPFSLEFSHNRSWNEVRRKISASLRDGGRHKPGDCVSKHKVAIIIPYRNRHEHLKHLLFYLHPMLVRQQLDYGIYVINQDGEGVFNRAKLMNVGFAEALKDYNYECFVFSDVDLVPMDDRNFYRCFESPRHLSVAIDKFNFQLPYNTIFGGVSSFSKQQFLTVNGYSNTYWGWGGEDDDMYKRIIFHGMSINRPDHMTGKYKMIKHDRDDHNADNPERLDKLSHTRETMDKDGINTLNYTVKDIVKDRMYTFINVDIKAP